MTNAKKRDAGLGRGLDSLIEDNSPVIKGRPQVVRHDENEKKEFRRENSNSLYRKDGAMSSVSKTPRRSGS